VDKLLKIGIPIMIILLMLIVVGTGLLLARGSNTSTLARPTASYAGYSTGTVPSCCLGQGGFYGGNSGNTGNTGNPANLPPCCRGYQQ
jgi:hypothetical protein